MKDQFIIGTYNLSEQHFDLLIKKFQESDGIVRNIHDISELNDSNLLFLPDVLLIDSNAISIDFVNMLYEIVKKKKMVVVSLDAEECLKDSNIYNLHYDSDISTRIANDIIKTMATTIRLLKIQNLSFNIVEYEQLCDQIKKHEHECREKDCKYEDPNDQESYLNREDFINMMMSILTFIETKDNYTKNHCERVAIYSSLYAQSMGLSESKVQQYYYTGLLHDIGKIGIPDEVLSKAGILNKEEYDMLKKHTEIVENLLPEKVFRGLKKIIRAHHEKYDGSGYPDGFACEEIPYEARVLAVVDAFDAMTTKRQYNRQKNLGEAIAEIEKCSGTQFDPIIARDFISLLKNNSIIISYFEQKDQAENDLLSTEYDKQI